MSYFDFAIYGGDWALLLLRIVLAVIFLYHGIKKFSLWKMKPSAQMPSSMLVLMRILSIVEPIAGLAVLLGVYNQYAAGSLAIVMLGALYYKIFVWKKQFDGDGGWEFDLLILAVCILFVVFGSGIFSLAGLY